MSEAFFDALHADPWAEKFLDLNSLNGSVSDAIESNVRHVRDVARTRPEELRSNSLVVLGPPGAGKTHLFARVRRKLGPRAVFVHVRPLVHAEMTPRFLLGEVVKQLGYGTHGVSALRQAHALVGSLLAHLGGQGTFFPNAFLADCLAMTEPERDARLDATVEQVLELWQEVDESYLRRLLQVPFAKSAAFERALLAWLSGRDCDLTQLARIGATASLSEDLALPALRTLSAVASLGAPIVLVFDQLENLVDADGPGSRLLAYANLTAELVDSMRGLVIVHMALDTEWARGIEPALNLSQRSRILMARDTLSLPTPKQREDLLELWSRELTERAAAFPWPFTEKQLRRVCHQPGVTPRMLLIEFRRALSGELGDGDVPEASDVTAEELTNKEERPRLLAEWQERLSEARRLADEASQQRICLDPSRLADGLFACGRLLQGVRFSPIKGAEAGHLTLTTSRGASHLAILHQGHPNSLGSALKKLTRLAEQNPVIVLRDQALDLPPTWKETLARKNELLAAGRARWLWLDREDAVLLLALDAMLQGARSGEISDERGKSLSETAVAEWLNTTIELSKCRVIQELLNPEAQEEEPSAVSPARFGAPGANQGSGIPRSQVLERPAAGPGMALAMLKRLRVASLDRVVREVIRVDPGATRTSVIAELERTPSEVHWFGRAVLGVRLF
jgi:hypothetical protein